MDKADALRQKRKRAISLLDSLTQSIFLEMFETSISGDNSAAFLPLANLVSEKLQNGAYFPAEAYTDDGVEMVHMGDAFYGTVSRGNLKRVRSVPAIKKYLLSSNDLLVARRSLNIEGAAKPCRISDSSEPLIFESSLIRIRTDTNKIMSEFLFHYLSNDRVKSRFISPYITQSTISGINQKNLEKVQVLVPPLAQQERFVSVATAITAEREQMTNEGRKIDDLFASLQHRAFSGQL